MDRLYAFKTLKNGEFELLHPFSIGLDSIVNTDPAALAGMLVYVRTMDIMDLSGNVLETPPSSDSDRSFQ